MSIKYTPAWEPREGELLMKTWVHEEARRAGKTPGAIYHRIYKGRYSGLQFRRVNRRIVFVKI